MLFVISDGNYVVTRWNCVQQDTAHAAASVHATVMSEEDAQSEGETNLSSMRCAAQRSAPVRGDMAPSHARRPQHHSAGLSADMCRAHALLSSSRATSSNIAQMRWTLEVWKGWTPAAGLPEKGCE